jgi:predicted transposase/invertase (TIGR01784 family)
MHYLNNLRGEAMEQIASQNQMIRKSMTVEQIFVKNEEERLQNELRLKALRDYQNTIEYAENNGIKRGIEKGRAEGRVEGRAEGFNEGLILTAKNLLAMNMSLENIAKATGLSIDDIKKL